MLKNVRNDMNHQDGYAKIWEDSIYHWIEEKMKEMMYSALTYTMGWITIISGKNFYVNIPNWTSAFFKFNILNCTLGKFH